MITFKNASNAGPKYSSMDVTFDESIAVDDCFGVIFKITQGPRRKQCDCILNETQIRKLHEELGNVLLNYGNGPVVEPEPMIVGEDIENTDF